MKKICWVTADYFLDVDISLVPYLQRTCSDFKIEWYVLTGKNSKVQVPMDTPTKIFRFSHRMRSPLIIAEYYRIFKEMRLKDSDIIYSDVVGLPYHQPILSIMSGKRPIVHGAHNVKPYPVWPLSLKLYVKYVLTTNSHFQMFSKHTAKWFKEHYPNKSFFYAPMVVKDFGEVQTDNYKIDNSKINLLFFGNILANKRLDLLIDAIKALPADVQEKVHLNICGNCRMDKDAIMRQIGNCKCISTYFKRIPDEEIPELFTKHQFFMLPYQDVAQSGPHMIAYNYNLPVIASDIEGFAERVEDGKNGFLFRRNNMVSLRDAIITAVTLDNEDYKNLKDNLHFYVQENFSLEAVSKRYIEYFKSILR